MIKRAFLAYFLMIRPPYLGSKVIQNFSSPSFVIALVVGLQAKFGVAPSNMTEKNVCGFGPIGDFWELLAKNGFCDIIK